MVAPRRETRLKSQGAPTGRSRSCSTSASRSHRIANRPRVFIARSSTVAAEMHSFPLIRDQKFARECAFSRDRPRWLLFLCVNSNIFMFFSPLLTLYAAHLLVRGQRLLALEARAEPHVEVAVRARQPRFSFGGVGLGGAIVVGAFPCARLALLAARHRGRHAASDKRGRGRRRLFLHVDQQEVRA